MGIPFATRTVNLNYDEKDWFIGLQASSASMDLLSYLIVLLFSEWRAGTPLCKLLYFSCSAASNTFEEQERFITLPVATYKVYICLCAPLFIVFSFAGTLGILSPQHGAPYCFSPDQAFVYLFGVAVCAYHCWSYGWLRSASCFLAREYAE